MMLTENSSMPRVAVVAHVYYALLWKELLACIENVDGKVVDVFITVVTEKMSDLVKEDCPRAHVMKVENRGYDILPFFTVLDGLDLSRYDLVVKLHTKRDCDDWVNCWPVFGSCWRRKLLSFCATKDNWHRTLGRFEDPSVGMVANGSLIVGKPDVYWESETCFSFAKAEIMRIGLQLNEHLEFVAGTMFAVKAHLLRPLVGKVESKVFDSCMEHICGTPAHSYERLLGYIVKSQGFIITEFNRIQWAYRLTEPFRVPLFRLMRWTKRRILNNIMQVKSDNPEGGCRRSM